MAAKSPSAEVGDAHASIVPALAAALVFLASGAVLVLEILAVRLLAPYVGLTLETTTSIIGAALAGIAAGAAAGGWLADRIDARRLLVRAAGRRRPADAADRPARARARTGRARRRRRRRARHHADRARAAGRGAQRRDADRRAPAAARPPRQRHDRRRHLRLGDGGRARRHVRHRLRARAARPRQQRRAGDRHRARADRPAARRAPARLAPPRSPRSSRSPPPRSAR